MENYSLLKMLVLDEILGMKASYDMSRDLGFSFDKYKRWMNNDKILRWNEFIDICDKNNLNLSSSMEILKIARDDAFDPVKLFNHLKMINAFKTNQEVADYLKCHVSVVQRFSNGATIPDFETIFKLINFKLNDLALFISRLFSDQITNPLLKKWIDNDINFARFESKYPLSSMISAALCLEEYREKDKATAEWLSDVLKIDLATIKNAMIKMQESKVIEETSPDIYITDHTTTNLDGVTTLEIIPFIQYLNRTLIDKLELRKSPEFQSKSAAGAMAFRVFPASLEAIDKINMIIIKAHTEILKTLEEDKNPKVEVRTILLQNFNLSK